MRTILDFTTEFLLLSCLLILTLELPRSCTTQISVHQNQQPWKRSLLIYLNSKRTDDQWRGHIMRADPSGKFVPQQLFDSVTLTTEFPGGTPTLPDTLLNENSLLQLIQNFSSQAAQLNDALSFFSRSGELKQALKNISLIMGVPYFPNKEFMIELNGQKYQLSNPSHRQSVTSWYLDQVKSRIDRDRQNWTENLTFWGFYYMREDILDYNGDVQLVQSMNRRARDLNLQTLWVPYYDAPYAWRGERESAGISLSFNVTCVQPRYAFLSSVDAGDLKPDRLYSTGAHSSALGHSFEYELRGNGESLVEFYISHQYLAVSQETGSSNYPQVFFVGGGENLIEIFDMAYLGQKGSKGSSWRAYEDLANYLKGDKIANFEIKIRAAMEIGGPDKDKDIFSIQWVVPKSHENLNSIRLDFSEVSLDNPWRGRVTVFVPVGNTKDSVGSFTVRSGSEEIYPQYSSVYVPIGNVKTPQGIKILLQISREAGSPWPKILQIVGAKSEPPTIANPIFQQISNSSRPNLSKPYADSKNSHLTFQRGKLTDGKISPQKFWGWDGVMGWNWIEYPFSVTIDLGKSYRISKVNVVTHFDLSAGVRLPVKMSALISPDCEPHIRGTTGLSCLPTFSSGKEQRSRLSGTNVNLTLPFPPNNVTGRYVTISGVSLAWCLLDEIEVLDGQNAVISTGAQYKVTPIPGDLRAPGNPAYGDNNQLLLDGNVFSQWIPGYGVDGMEQTTNKDGSTQGSSVEATWSLGQGQGQVKRLSNATFAVVWVTNAMPSVGIKLPDWVNMQYRNERGVWSKEERVAPLSEADCGPSPCIKLRLSQDGKVKPTVTGVRATFPPQTWYMVSEISLE